MTSRKRNTNKPIDKDVRNNILTIRLSDDELKIIEKIAKEVNIPKTRFARNLLLASLDDANFLNNIGVLKGVKKIIDFKERYLNPEKYQTLKTA